MKRCILGLFVAAALQSSVLHAAQPEPLRVLFVGNSYTYFKQCAGDVCCIGARGNARPTGRDPHGCHTWRDPGLVVGAL